MNARPRPLLARTLALGIAVSVALLTAAPAIAQDPDYGDCIKGVQALRYQTYDLAIHYCSKVIREGRIPVEAMAWVLDQRAAAYAGKGNAARAIGDTDAAAAYREALAQQVQQRAVADEQLQAVLYQQARTYNPQSAFVYLYQGVQQGRAGDFAGAVASLSRAIELEADSPMPWYNRGVSYLFLRRPADANADLDTAARLAPQFALVYYNRGLARTGLGDTFGALADYGEAIRLLPAYPEAFNNRGFLLESLGRRDEAAADFTAAYRLDPTNRQLRAKLIQLGITP